MTDDFVENMKMKWGPRDYPLSTTFKETGSLKDLDILWAELHKDFAEALQKLVDRRRKNSTRQTRKR